MAADQPGSRVMSSCAGAGRIYRGLHQNRAAIPRVGDTDHRRGKSCAPNRCPATARFSRWSFPASIRLTAHIILICATRLEKLQLNDASLSFEPETSAALGIRLPLRFSWAAAHGDHPGAAGAGISTSTSSPLLPSVIYKLTLTGGERDNGSTTRPSIPIPALIAAAEEPFVKANILYSNRLCRQYHGTLPGAGGAFIIDTKYLDADRVELHYELPLNEIVYDFFDALKSRTKGYASFDYEFCRLSCRRSWSSWTSCSTGRWWTRCPSSSTRTKPIRARASMC